VVEKLAMRGWRTSDVKTDRLGTAETKRAAAGVRSARVNALAANIFAIEIGGFSLWIKERLVGCLWQGYERSEEMGKNQNLDYVLAKTNPEMGRTHHAMQEWANQKRLNRHEQL
jgi:hypothetical protein